MIILESFVYITVMFDNVSGVIAYTKENILAFDTQTTISSVADPSLWNTEAKFLASRLN